MDTKQEKQKVSKKALWYLSQLILLLVVVVGFRTFVFSTVTVKGSSMEPTFTHGNIVGVNKIFYLFAQPKQGDIIICKLESGTGKQEQIIKRVIGLPGDRIEIKELDTYDLEYELYRNEEPIEEDYILEPMQQPGNLQYPYTVPEKSYFVMGDNRNASTDSRNKSIQAISKQDIIGKVCFKLRPFGRVEGGNE